MAFEKLAAIQNEETIEEILNFLDAITSNPKPRVYNLSRHYESLSSQYDETLQKLAQ